MHSLTLRTILTSTVLAGCLPAQEWLFQAGEVSRLTIGEGAPADFRAAVAGHLLGFHANDAVVLCNGSPVLIAAPGVHRTAVPLPIPSSAPVSFRIAEKFDVAVLRAAGQDQRDVLLLSTEAGLFRWQMIATQQPSEPLVWTQQLDQLGGSAWNGVSRLRVADVDGDGVADVLGLMANGHKIRCLQLGPAGGNWVIDVGVRVRDFVVSDLIAGGMPEISVLLAPVYDPADPQQMTFAGGVRVFAPDNDVPLMQFALPNSTGVMAGIADGACRGLAVASSSGSQHTLSTLQYEAGGLAFADAITLADEPTAMTVGKWRSAHEDLLITVRHLSAPLQVPHLGQLQLGEDSIVPLGAQAATDNMASPLLADLQGDPDAAHDSLRCDNLLIYPESLTGKVVIQNRIVYDSRFVQMALVPQGLGIAQPPELPGQPGVHASHVEANVWMLETNPLAYASPTSRRDPLAIQYSGESWSCTLNEHYQGAPALLMALRFVVLDQDGEVLTYYPVRATVGSLSSSLLPILSSTGGIEHQVFTIVTAGITGEIVQPPAGPEIPVEEPPATGG